MAHVFNFRTDGKKCPGCGYHVTNHWIIEETRAAAETEFEEREGGLCGDCLLDVLSNEKAEVEKV